MLGNIDCRRTYIGSMPGRILNALKTVGVKNPVILLDEVDKMVIFTAYNYFLNGPFLPMSRFSDFFIQTKK